jgi:hypothetical protein
MPAVGQLHDAFSRPQRVLGLQCQPHFVMRRTDPAYLCRAQAETSGRGTEGQPLPRLSPSAQEVPQKDVREDEESKCPFLAAA